VGNRAAKHFRPVPQIPDGQELTTPPVRSCTSDFALMKTDCRRIEQNVIRFIFFRQSNRWIIANIEDWNELLKRDVNAESSARFLNLVPQSW